MKTKFALGLTILTLVLAALACKPLWQPEPESPEGTSTHTQEAPTITVTVESAPDLVVFTNPVIFNFSFFTATEGWAVTKDGNHLLFTADGGETWLEATPTGLYPLPPGITSLNLRPFFLDEATASIDPFTERQIQQALDLILKDSTSILIAHRLSTVKSADRIIVIDKGKIIEEGTHESLLNGGGYYSVLYNTYFRHQSLTYVEESGKLAK